MSRESSTTFGGLPMETRADTARLWVLAAIPVLLLAGLLAALVYLGPSSLITNGDAPPVERLAISRVTLQPGEIRLSVINDGPDAVTVAQVAVDDAFWTFRMEPSTTLTRLASGEVVIPYPWVRGDTHHVRLLTSSGITIDH